MTPKIDEGAGSSDGNYSTIFDSTELGLVFSQVHAAMITAGTELEKIVVNECEKTCTVLDNLDDFLDARKNEKGVFMATKKVVKGSERLVVDANEPDFIIFVNNDVKHCYIIELKWGNNFDTKKAAGEIRSLRKYQAHISSNIEYITSAHICSFMVDSEAEIQKGLKKKVELHEVMTGEKFCDLVGIQRSDVVDKMRGDGVFNREYIAKKLMEAEGMEEIFRRLISDKDKQK